MTRHLRLGLITAAIVYGVTALVFLQVPSKLFGEKGTEVAIRFGQTADLVKGDPVRVHGVTAGKVTDVDVADGGRSALVKIDVFDDAMPVYDDARAAIRWRTVLGGNEYVDLERGTSAAGRLQGAIGLDRTETQVEIDDLTHAVDGAAGPGLQSTFKELGIGLGRPGAVRDVVTDTGRVAPTITRAVDALRGETDGDLRALIDSSAAVVKSVDGADQPVRRLLEGAGLTLGVTARRAQAIESMLRQSPGTLADIDITLADVDHTLDLADPLVADLRPAARAAGPTLHDLRPVLTGASRLLVTARPVLDELRPAVAAVARASRKGAPLLQGLQPSLRRIDAEILPHFAEKDPVTRRAAYQMIGPTLSAAMDATGLYDSTGRYLRFPALSNNNPFDSVPCRFVVGDPEAAGQIAYCESVLGVLNGLLKSPLTR